MKNEKVETVKLTDVEARSTSPRDIVIIIIIIGPLLAGLFIGALTTLKMYSFPCKSTYQYNCCHGFAVENNCSICCPMFSKAMCIKGDVSRNSYCYCEEDALSVKIKKLEKEIIGVMVQKDNLEKELEVTNATAYKLLDKNEKLNKLLKDCISKLPKITKK